MSTEETRTLPTICVAIPTYLREQALVHTIEQVLAQDPPADEILVIDQTPYHEDLTRDYLSGQHCAGRIKWIRCSPPSLPDARNKAALATCCDVIIYVDDDVILPHGLAANHRRNYQDPSIAAVAGQIYQPVTPRVDLVHCRQSGEAPSEGCTSFPFRAGQLVDFVVGCNFSVRRSALLAIRGFDEQFIGAANGEDSDFAQRLILSGRRIVFDTDAWVVHLKLPSGGCRIVGNRAYVEWMKTVSMLIYAFRHGFRTGEYRYYLLKALRAGPLRRENALRPLCWPYAWGSFAFAVFEGIRRARTGVRSGVPS